MDEEIVRVSRASSEAGSTRPTEGVNRSVREPMNWLPSSRTTTRTAEVLATERFDLPRGTQDELPNTRAVGQQLLQARQLLSARVADDAEHHPPQRPLRATVGQIRVVAEQELEVSLVCPPVVPPRRLVNENEGISCVASLLDRLPTAVPIDDPAIAPHDPVVALLDLLVRRQLPCRQPPDPVHLVQWQPQRRRDPAGER